MKAFKTYDIRGIYGVDIDQKLAFKIGYAFVCIIAKKKILVGYDARMYSKELLDAFSLGAKLGGAIIYNVGLTTTPALHYLQIKNRLSSGVMVTASHNPAEYHGFKFFDESGGSISYHKGLKDIEIFIQNNQIKVPERFPVLPVTYNNRVSEYINFITKNVSSPGSKLKIVIDVSNGSAGEVVRAVVEKIDIDVVILNSNPDGTFPVHSPNPLDFKSHKLVASEVQNNNAHLGALLDGDGDRVIFFDEKGRLIESNFSSSLIALALLNRYPKSVIVHDLIASRVFSEIILQAGGLPVSSRIGYTFLYDKMREHKAVFGSETSGHLYFRVNDNFYTESAIYGIFILLNYLIEKNKPISKLIEPLRSRYFQQQEVNIDIKNINVDEILCKISSAYSSTKQDKIDGLSIYGDTAWFNIRPSNTEPLLRLTVEAVNKQVADKTTNLILSLINS